MSKALLITTNKNAVNIIYRKCCQFIDILKRCSYIIRLCFEYIKIFYNSFILAEMMKVLEKYCHNFNPIRKCCQ